MKSCVANILESFGESVTLHAAKSADGIDVRAFIQPLMNRTVTEKGTVKTPLGITDNTRFYYIGPSGMGISPADGAYLLRCGERFEFLAAESVCVGGEEIHCEGILRRRDDL